MEWSLEEERPRDPHHVHFLHQLKGATKDDGTKAKEDQQGGRPPDLFEGHDPHRELRAL